MAKEIKITTIEVSMMEDEDFKAPSKFYFINALGQAVFIHCRDRKVAEEYIKNNYGTGFYKLRTTSLEKSSGEHTATGSNTRKCFSSRLKGLK